MIACLRYLINPTNQYDLKKVGDNVIRPVSVTVVFLLGHTWYNNKGVIDN